jgi:hypothetical protein
MHALPLFHQSRTELGFRLLDGCAVGNCEKETRISKAHIFNRALIAEGGFGSCVTFPNSITLSSGRAGDEDQDRVDGWLMPMPMRMRLSERPVVLVLAMLIVAVFMFKRIVLVFMFMPLTQTFPPCLMAAAPLLLAGLIRL